MKNLKVKKYKTYAGKPTKYQRERAYKQKKIFLLACAFFLILGLNYERIMVNAEVKRYNHTKLEQTAHHEHPVASGEALEGKPKVEITTLYTNRPDIETQIHLIAEEECNKRGHGDFCIKDMLAMAWTESRLDPNAIGDNGASHGLYQIHLGYHPHITQAQARDIEFSIKWTLDRLEKYNYPVYRSYAIRRHNGSATNPRTLAYLDSVNSTVFWSK
jgi:hypothetical protein